MEVEGEVLMRMVNDVQTLMMKGDEDEEHEDDEDDEDGENENSVHGEQHGDEDESNGNVVSYHWTKYHLTLLTMNGQSMKSHFDYRLNKFYHFDGFDDDDDGDGVEPQHRLNN